MTESVFQKAQKLWLDYARAKHALLKAGFIRSYKSTEADFSEWLICFIYGGELPASKSYGGYDVIAGDKRIQVKSIAKMPDNQNGYIISKKDRNNNPEIGATHYAFVFYNELIPVSIYLVPENYVRNFPKQQIRMSNLEKANSKIDMTPFNFEEAG